MPTYEYECKTCSHTFEVFQSMSDEPVKSCPECGKDVRRLINGGTGIIFKGKGFYVTDKAGGKSSGLTKSSKSGDTASGTSQPPAASEKKPASTQPVQPSATKAAKS